VLKIVVMDSKLGLKVVMMDYLVTIEVVSMIVLHRFQVGNVQPEQTAHHQFVMKFVMTG